MTKIIAYKGFNPDWTCRDFQFEVGKAYEHSGPVKPCASGFHACTHPLDVFGYYEPGASRFALVEMEGHVAEHDGDSKVAAARIKITAEIQISDMIEAAVKAVFDAAKVVKGAVAKARGAAAVVQGGHEAASATGDSGAASATGYRGAASATGYRGAASATGYSGAASATGYRGAASATGDSGAASATGYRGAASATGYRGAASATGDSGAASATGYRGAASATGYRGAASATGDSGAASATGDSGAAMASGCKGKAMGAEGCALFLCERDDDDNILHVWAGIAGRDSIKPLTFYTLQDGKPVEVSE